MLTFATGIAVAAALVVFIASMGNSNSGGAPPSGRSTQQAHTRPIPAGWQRSTDGKHIVIHAPMPTDPPAAQARAEREGQLQTQQEQPDGGEQQKSSSEETQQDE